MKFLFVGDIMPGGVLHYQENYIDSELLNYMHGFDCRVGTLECAVGNNFEKDINKQRVIKPVVYALEEHLKKVKEMGINYVSIANNHVFDLGVDGFLNTLRKLDELGIKYFGAGVDFEHAKQPAVISLDGGMQLAIIGCLVDYEKPVVFYHPSEKYPCLNIQSVDDICNDIVEAKKKYDYVFVLPHWGLEHIYFQPDFIRKAAFQMIDSGADAIMGGHPHIVNPRVSYRRKDVFFSMGNFLFADRVTKFPKDMYYPDRNVMSTLSKKLCIPYPKCEDPFIAVWPSKNRVGMMIECNMDKRIISDTKFVLLDKDNVLHLYQRWILRVHLILIGHLYKLPFYGKIRRVFSSSKNFFMPLLDRLSFPSIKL